MLQWSGVPRGDGRVTQARFGPDRRSASNRGAAGWTDGVVPAGGPESGCLPTGERPSCIDARLVRASKIPVLPQRGYLRNRAGARATGTVIRSLLRPAARAITRIGPGRSPACTMAAAWPLKSFRRVALSGE